MSTRQLDVKAFGLTCGLIWGVGIFCATWWVMAFEGASGEITTLGYVYRGYNLSPAGSVIGLVWGLFDGGIGGLIFAWLYNLLAGKMTCCKGKTE